MSVLYIMLPAALLVAAGAVAAFILAARNGQYDDLDTPAYRMLPDDDGLTPTKAASPVVVVRPGPSKR